MLNGQQKQVVFAKQAARFCYPFDRSSNVIQNLSTAHGNDRLQKAFFCVVSKNKQIWFDISQGGIWRHHKLANLTNRTLKDSIRFTYLVSGPCQPFTANQSLLCTEFETLVDANGVGKFCDKSQASCRVNTTFYGPHSRDDRFWGYCYCDEICKGIGDCCVDYDQW